MQIQSNFIERVKREVGIESYISRFIKLKKQGKRSLGLCPFHQEKSPSFTVSNELGFFYCFGCHKSGDIISFVKDFERVEFTKALEILSDYSGIPLDAKFNPQEASEKEELFRLNQEYLDYFKKNLFSSEGRLARDYLHSRNISDSEIERFELGLALPGFENSTEKLLNSPEKWKNALKLGLIKQKTNSKGGYDFYRDRIMFPIKDFAGRVCGFGGRIYKDSEEAKYINSPTSPIYDKGKMFYGMFLAQNSIRKHRKVILVEGYLDVIGLHSREIDYVLAPLGTALTNNQVRNLKSLADEILLLFDGDNAGKKAALRGSEICLKEGVDCGIVLLEAGLDPFDLSRQKTRTEIIEYISKPISQSNFIIKETLENAGGDSPPELKKKALDNLYRFIKSLEKETDKELYVKEGARQLGLSISSVWNDFKNGGVVSLAPSVVDNKKEIVKKSSGKLEQCERKILSLLVLHNELFEFIDDLQELEFSDDESFLFWNILYSKYS
ncbi:MAG: DNA primase, partial [Leptospiraceae bacterium]|nr:DNA primase [Leptospiraceae bacterium]